MSFLGCGGTDRAHYLCAADPADGRRMDAVDESARCLLFLTSSRSLRTGRFTKVLSWFRTDRRPLHRRGWFDISDEAADWIEAIANDEDPEVSGASV